MELGFIAVFMLPSPGCVGEGVTFLNCPVVNSFVRPKVKGQGHSRPPRWRRYPRRRWGVGVHLLVVVIIRPHRLHEVHAMRPFVQMPSVFLQVYISNDSNLILSNAAHVYEMR